MISKACLDLNFNDAYLERAKQLFVILLKEKIILFKNKIIPQRKYSFMNWQDNWTKKRLQ